MLIFCNALSARNLATALTALTLAKLINHLVGYAERATKLKLAKVSTGILS